MGKGKIKVIKAKEDGTVLKDKEVKQKVLIDTCVLFPGTVRRLFIRLSELNAIVPYWSDGIFDEWKRVCSRDSKEHVHQIIEWLDNRFPESRISGYDKHINKIRLYDKFDRHIVAAAIQGNIPLLITFNTKDFPFGRLKEHGIERMHADLFSLKILKEKPEIALLLAKELDLERLKKAWMPHSAALLEKLLQEEN